MNNLPVEQTKETLEQLNERSILQIIKEQKQIALCLFIKDEESDLIKYTLSVNQQNCKTQTEKLLIQDLNQFYHRYFVLKSRKYELDTQKKLIKFIYQMQLNKVNKTLKWVIQFKVQIQKQQKQQKIFKNDFFTLKQKIVKNKLVLSQNKIKFVVSRNLDYCFNLQKSDIDSFDFTQTHNLRILTKIKQSKNQWSEIWMKVNPNKIGQLNQIERAILVEYNKYLQIQQIKYTFYIPFIKYPNIQNIQKQVPKRMYVKLRFFNQKQVQLFNDQTLLYQNDLINIPNPSQYLSGIIVDCSKDFVMLSTIYKDNSKNIKKFNNNQDFQIGLGVKNIGQAIIIHVSPY